MAVLSKITHPGVVDYFKELPLYKKHVKSKRLKNIDQLTELPFFWATEHNKNKSIV